MPDAALTSLDNYENQVIISKYKFNMFGSLWPASTRKISIH